MEISGFGAFGFGGADKHAKKKGRGPTLERGRHLGPSRTLATSPKTALMRAYIWVSLIIGNMILNLGGSYMKDSSLDWGTLSVENACMYVVVRMYVCMCVCVRVSIHIYIYMAFPKMGDQNIMPL